MTYNLGIAIDAVSIGFAGVDPLANTIKFCGTHIFDAAENPKDGSPLNMHRREKRAQRRVIRRRACRKKDIRRLLARHGITDMESIDISRHHPKTAPGIFPITPWNLRKAALERKLQDGEFARVLFHIAKRRGFQSGRKGAATNDTEGRAILGGAKMFEEAMMAAGAPTAGAYLATLPTQRNAAGAYDRFCTRDLLRQEIKKIFEAQRKFGNDKASPELMKAYAGDGDPKKRNTLEGDGIAFYQRPLQSSEHLVGTCIFTGKKRAAKFSYTAELFVLWSKLNNAKIKTMAGGERFLTQAEKNKLADLAHKNSGGVSYTQARKELKLLEAERFNISYRKTKNDDDNWEKIRTATEKVTGNFIKLPGYHTLKTAMDTGSEPDWEKWSGKNRNNLDSIARILSFEKDSNEIIQKLQTLGLDKKQTERLCTISHFSKTINLSPQAINNILPHMQEGLVYSSACAAAGYDHTRPKENKGFGKLPPFNFSADDIPHPVVYRALAHSRKVINGCLDKYGMPEIIIIEFARNLGKPFRERKDIERQQKKNSVARDEAKNHAAEILGINTDNLSGGDILKYRLWKEQDGFCPYSGIYMTPQILRDYAATRIDFIIPYSRSWNNSYMNKVLCIADENRKKGEKTPYEYLGGTSRWEALEAFSRQLPPQKAQSLMMENFDQDKAARWQSRSLNDTRYIARLLKNHIEEMLWVGEDGGVQTRNSALIHHLRGTWGFPDEQIMPLADRRPAMEAIIVACSTQGMMQKLTRWNKYEKRRENAQEQHRPPKPWKDFYEDTMDAVARVFVSRQPVRKITGAAHQETLRSICKSDEKVIQRVRIQNLTAEALENIVDRERNVKLYIVLKERLQAHGGLAQKAFIDPVFMPVNNTRIQGPRINSVRIVTNKKSGIMINEGLASNGDMARTDVFWKDGKFFLVPVYVHHFASKKLPDRAILIQKPEHEWEKMIPEDFIFSLYKNDLVRIQNKNEDYFAYYVGTDRATGALSLRAHDSSQDFGKNGIKRAGVKNLLIFEKYSVDHFGNKEIMPKETREN